VPAALAGIRVLDLTQIMAGPFCTMLLADLGAEVVKIENPRGGDDSRRMAPPYYNGESAAFMAMNRNKQGIAVNIRTPIGKQVLWRLLESADVLVENFRPGTLTRLAHISCLASARSSSSSSISLWHESQGDCLVWHYDHCARTSVRRPPLAVTSTG
jgi:hypothetical protein